MQNYKDAVLLKIVTQKKYIIYTLYFLFSYLILVFVRVYYIFDDKDLAKFEMLIF